MGWRFAWLRGWPEIWAPEHRARWLALLDHPDAHASPFVHPALVRAWLEAKGGEASFQPCFLWATHPSGQELFWPLVVVAGGWRHGFLRRLLPVGAALRPFRPGGTLYDYHEPAVAPSAGDPVLAPGFWPAFTAELDRRQGAWFDQCAFPKLRPIGLPEGMPAGVAPFVALDAYPDFDAYFAARKARVRNAIRRRIRNLEAEGAVTFEVHGPDEVETVLGWLPSLEAARARRYPGSDLPAGFLSGLVTEGLPAGILHCTSLSLDGRAISWDLGFWQGGCFYGYIRSFETGLAHLSPGVVHLARLIDWLYAHGGRKLDFLVGQEDYKAEWTDGAEMPVTGLTRLSGAPASLARRGLARTLRRLRVPA